MIAAPCLGARVRHIKSGRIGHVAAERILVAQSKMLGPIGATFFEVDFSEALKTASPDWRELPREARFFTAGDLEVIA